jgi:stearoyl-CoA desaturase (delta-9 desaturase)
LPIQWFIGPVQGAIVNWCGHKYGYSNFDNNDKSKNTLPMDFFLLGELFQNNHHKSPNSPNFAKRWFEFDPVFPVMLLLSKVGIIKMRRVRA